ncbi:uncharacterized protein DNG_03021 [Cephalotrichum gorgonifer]|uniref:C2 NT-type domain-containing protein n=1 Tax=Cephalotrichum gorgonifer TaxID=2041049 RepID=A0AAE8MTH0_9PEZI|nr:uncharacterized protein DNG_03021 [Cephalotrichum gorgonifer]
MEKPSHNRFTQKLTRLVNQPKFELHLKVFDLNNVPLVSGHSFIKWHLANSMHAEHRGRTSKYPILNHRVDYAYSKIIPSIRVPIDRHSNLGECFIELEVLQEFSMAAVGSRDERVPLGLVRLNLSEFVEESDALTARKRSASLTGVGYLGASPAAGSMGPPSAPAGESAVEDGVVRRYLMQESKINSTLKISILMVQVDGERNYVAPPLKTAPVFGGIAGFTTGEQVEQDDKAGHIPNINKSRDASELQDLYRSALTATWCAQPEEQPASDVIENIFSGGNGWNIPSSSGSSKPQDPSYDDDLESGGSVSGDDVHGGTLRPSDFRRVQRLVGMKLAEMASHRSSRTLRDERSMREERKKDGERGRAGSRSRSPSLASLAPTLGSSERGREVGLTKRAREVSEAEARDDMVAWRLTGKA